MTPVTKGIFIGIAIGVALVLVPEFVFFNYWYHWAEFIK